MKARLSLVCFVASLGIAQTETGKVLPEIRILSIQPNTAALLHLATGYSTAIRLPEDVSSVVVGNPASFRAEHSDGEPRLVLLKPTTALPSETNALITTRSGSEISLYLISSGKAQPSRLTRSARQSEKYRRRFLSTWLPRYQLVDRECAA